MNIDLVKYMETSAQAERGNRNDRYWSMQFSCKAKGKKNRMKTRSL